MSVFCGFVSLGQHFHHICALFLMCVLSFSQEAANDQKEQDAKAQTVKTEPKDEGFGHDWESDEESESKEKEQKEKEAEEEEEGSFSPVLIPLDEANEEVVDAEEDEQQLKAQREKVCVLVAR